MTPTPSGWDVAVAVVLAVTAVAYAAGVADVWRRLGAGRGFRWWETAAFGVGWLSLLAALSPYVHSRAEASFAVHMTQHELLMLVAAPLIVLGRPFIAVLRLTAPAVRPRLWWLRQHPVGGLWKRLTAPVAVLVIHGLVIWVWHIPALFETALRHQAVHAAQHLMFFWTAALFWWALIHGRYGRLGYGVSMMFVFVTAVHTGLLGALATFAPAAWYDTYRHSAAMHGGSALEDQQLAGLLMWVPSGVVMLIAGLALFAAWLGEAARRMPDRVHRAPHWWQLAADSDPGATNRGVTRHRGNGRV